MRRGAWDALVEERGLEMERVRTESAEEPGVL